MLGDHYPDETAEYRKTIPVQICELVYKCKLCGKTFSDVSIPVRGYDSEIGIMNGAIMNEKTDDPYYPELVSKFKSHFCGNGFGVAEYIGTHYHAEE